MSRYSTEVRYICESLAGMSESATYDEIENVINQTWDKVFSHTIPIYDENYRQSLMSAILRHYWTREIGFETVGLWQFKINTKLREIMPYYNEVYKTTLLELDPLEEFRHTKDYTKTFDSDTKTDTTTTNDRTTNATVDVSTNLDDTNNINSSIDNNKEHLDIYSDTPQNAITNVSSNGYMTEARKITDTDSTTNTNTTTYKGETTSNTVSADTSSDSSVANTSTIIDNVDTYIEKYFGHNTAPAELVMKFRESLINVDMMIINELDSLFMGIW